MNTDQNTQENMSSVETVKPTPLVKRQPAGALRIPDKYGLVGEFILIYALDKFLDESRKDRGSKDLTNEEQEAIDTNIKIATAMKTDLDLESAQRFLAAQGTPLIRSAIITDPGDPKNDIPSSVFELSDGAYLFEPDTQNDPLFKTRIEDFRNALKKFMETWICSTPVTVFLEGWDKPKEG